MKKEFFLGLQYLARLCLVARDNRAKLLPPLWQQLPEIKREGTAVPLSTVCPCHPQKLGSPLLRIFTFPASSPFPSPSRPHSGPSGLPLSRLSHSLSLPLVSLSQTLTPSGLSLSCPLSDCPSIDYICCGPCGYDYRLCECLCPVPVSVSLPLDVPVSVYSTSSVPHSLQGSISRLQARLVSGYLVCQIATLLSLLSCFTCFLL